MAETRKTKIIRTSTRLFPWQEEIIRGILAYPHDIHIAKSKRQIGKSITVEMALLYFFCNKRGSVSICISPTLNQSRKIFRELKNAMQDLPVYASANSTTLEIFGTNGSCIQLKSGEQEEGLRGATVSGILCIDEAVYIKSSTLYNVLPFVDANRAPILLTSTPKLRQGPFYEWFCKGVDGMPGFHSYDVNKYDTSVLLSPERLEMYRQSVAPQIFRSDYLGLWIDATSALFGDLDRLCSDVLTPSSHKVLGIDWSNGGVDASQNPDESALVLTNEFKQVEKYWSFSDKDTTQTIDFILDIIKTYRVEKAVVETNSMGATYVSLLKKRISASHINCRVIEFYSSQSSKQDIIQTLQVECQNGTIQLPKTDNEKLVLEMVSYEVSATKTGKLHYEGGNGVHDDLVMALAFSLYGLKTGSYVVR